MNNSTAIYITLIIIEVIFVTLAVARPEVDYEIFKAALPASLKTFEITGLNIISDVFGKTERSLGFNIHIAFAAFGKDFDLQLSAQKNKKIFPSTIRVNVISNKGKTTTGFKTDNLVQGTLIGDNMSFVNGNYEGRRFSGVIHAAKDIYYIRPLQYLANTADKRVVIYRESDFNKPQSTNSSETRCGVKDEEKYDFVQSINRQRPKRVGQSNNLMTICNLHLVIDHVYYNVISRKSAKIAVNEALFYLDVVNSIYYGTDFDGDTYPDRVFIHLEDITIYKVGYKRGFNRRKEYVDGSKILDDFADSAVTGFGNVGLRSSAYCMVALLTGRSLKGRVLGLSFTARVSLPGRGGICSKNGGNTLLVTAKLRDHDMSPFTIALTLAHELGHSFGSHHDNNKFPDLKCVPHDRFGKYLMHAYDSPGYLPNNKKFSKCSVNYMYPVINYFKKYSSCMHEIADSICGNAIVEDGEECDCGSTDICKSVDPCCSPPNSNTPCKFNHVTSFCSPKLSPCCKPDCTFVPKHVGVICRSATECTHTSFCNGSSAECPQSVDKDNELCLMDTRVCMNGSCLKSVCSLTGKHMMECQCLTPEDICKICCRDMAKVNSSCLPIDNQKHSYNRNFEYKSTGSVCGQDKGFCNVNHFCVSLDPDFDIIFYKDTTKHTVLQNLWYFLFLTIFTFGIALWTFTTFCIKKHKLRKKALVKLNDEALRHLRTIDVLLNKLEMHYTDAKQRIRRGHHRVTPRTIGYLRFLFPITAKEFMNKLIIEHYESKRGEKEIVTRLVRMGHPLQQMVHVKFDNNLQRISAAPLIRYQRHSI